MKDKISIFNKKRLRTWTQTELSGTLDHVIKLPTCIDCLAREMQKKVATQISERKFVYYTFTDM